MASVRRIAIGSRCMAAAFGGYAVANAVSIALAASLMLPRSEAALVATQTSFLVWVAAVLWAFAARSALTAWVGLLVPAGLASFVAWWLT